MDVGEGEIGKEESRSKLIFFDEETLSDEALADTVGRPFVGDESIAVDLSGDDACWDLMLRKRLWPLASEGLVSGSRREAS